MFKFLGSLNLVSKSRKKPGQEEIPSPASTSSPTGASEEIDSDLVCVGWTTNELQRTWEEYFAEPNELVSFEAFVDCLASSLDGVHGGDEIGGHPEVFIMDLVGTLFHYESTYNTNDDVSCGARRKGQLALRCLALISQFPRNRRLLLKKTRDAFPPVIIKLCRRYSSHVCSLTERVAKLMDQDGTSVVDSSEWDAIFVDYDHVLTCIRYMKALLVHTSGANESKLLSYIICPSVYTPHKDLEDFVTPFHGADSSSRDSDSHRSGNSMWGAYPGNIGSGDGWFTKVSGAGSFGEVLGIISQFFEAIRPLSNISPMGSSESCVQVNSLPSLTHALHVAINEYLYVLLVQLAASPVEKRIEMSKIVAPMRSHDCIKAFQSREDIDLSVQRLVIVLRMNEILLCRTEESSKWAQNAQTLDAGALSILFTWAQNISKWSSRIPSSDCSGTGDDQVDTKMICFFSFCARTSFGEVRRKTVLYPWYPDSAEPIDVNFSGNRYHCFGPPKSGDGGQTLQEHGGKPEFLVFQYIFSLLYSTCFKYKGKVQDMIPFSTRTVFLDIVLDALVNYCSYNAKEDEAEHKLVCDESSSLPYFQFAVCFFLQRCIEVGASSVVDLPSWPATVDTLLSHNFFLGGWNHILNSLKTSKAEVYTHELFAQHGWHASLSDIQPTVLWLLLHDTVLDVLSNVIAVRVTDSTDEFYDIRTMLTSKEKEPIIRPSIPSKRSKYGSRDSENMAIEFLEVNKIISTLSEAVHRSFTDTSNFVVLQGVRWLSRLIKCVAFESRQEKKVFSTLLQLLGKFSKVSSNVNKSASGAMMQDWDDPSTGKLGFVWYAQSAVIDAMLQFASDLPSGSLWIASQISGSAINATTGEDDDSTIFSRRGTVSSSTSTSSSSSSSTNPHRILRFNIDDRRSRRAVLEIFEIALNHCASAVHDGAILGNRRGSKLDVPLGKSLRVADTRVSARASVSALAESAFNLGGNLVYFLLKLVNQFAADRVQPSIDIIHFLTDIFSSRNPNGHVLKRFIKFSQDYVVDQVSKCLMQSFDEGIRRAQAEHHRRLVLQTLALVTELQQNSASERSKFHASALLSWKGRPAGIDRLLEDQPIHFEHFLALFNMLFDGTSFNGNAMYVRSRDTAGLIETGLFAEERPLPKICNTNVFITLVRLVPRASPLLQKCILKSCSQLVTDSLINLGKCISMEPPLLNVCLTIVPLLPDDVLPDVVDLLQRLGKYSMTVSQLKLMFRMMQSPDALNRPSHAGAIVDTFRAMLIEDKITGPQTSFVFEGFNSGLTLPQGLSWPMKAKGAFAFSTWIKVDPPHLPSSFQTPGASKCILTYDPTIIMMRGTEGEMFHLGLVGTDRKDTFSVKLESKRDWDKGSMIQPTNILVKEGRWHFIAISFSSGNLVTSGASNKREMVLMVDDNQISRHWVHVPFSGGGSGDLLEGSIGWASSASATTVSTNHVTTTLRGQMGSVYLFADSLTEEQMRGMYSLGSSYGHCFDAHSIASARAQSMESGMNSTGIDMTGAIADGNLVSSIMLSYNPGMRNDGIFFDSTPINNPVRWTKKIKDGSIISCDAKRRSGTYVWTAQPFSQALASVGGLKTFLPLFTQLDRPLLFHDGTIGTEIDTKLCSQILRIILGLAQSTTRSYRELIDNPGHGDFDVISYLLRQVSGAHLTPKVPLILEACLDALEWSSARLRRSLVGTLLLDFDLWARAPVESRIIHGEVLLRVVRLSRWNEGMFAELCTVSKLLNALSTHAEYDSLSDDTNKGRPPHTMIRKMRRLIWTLMLRIAYLPGHAFDTLTVGLLLAYAAATPAPESCLECLQAILSLISSNVAERRPTPEMCAGVVAGISGELQGCNLLLELAKDLDSSILVVFIIIEALNQPKSIWKVAKVDSSALTGDHLKMALGNVIKYLPPSVPCSDSEGDPEKVRISRIVLCLAKKLQDTMVGDEEHFNEFSNLLKLFPLFSVPLDERLSPLTLPDMDPQNPSIGIIMPDTVRKLRLPLIFPGLLMLTAESAVPGTIRQFVVANLNTLCKSVVICDQIMRVNGWLESILHVYKKETADAPTLKQESIQNMCISILSEFIVNSMYINTLTPQGMSSGDDGSLDEAPWRCLAYDNIISDLVRKDRAYGVHLLRGMMGAIDWIISREGGSDKDDDRAREHKIILVSSVVTRLVSEVEANRPEERVQEIFGVSCENDLVMIVKGVALNIYLVLAVTLNFLRQNVSHANLLANEKFKSVVGSVAFDVVRLTNRLRFMLETQFSVSISSMGFKFHTFMTHGRGAARLLQAAQEEITELEKRDTRNPSSPFKSPQKGHKETTAPLLDSAAQRIDQNLLRMLCSVAGMGDLNALRAIKRIAFGAEDGDDDAKMYPKPLVQSGSSSWDDIIYVVVVLSHALRYTEKCLSDPWSTQALDILSMLLGEVFEVVNDKLGQYRMESVGSPMGEDNASAESTSDVCDAMSQIVATRFGHVCAGCSPTNILDIWDLFVVNEMALGADKEQELWASNDDIIHVDTFSDRGRGMSFFSDQSREDSTTSLAEIVERAQARFRTDILEYQMSRESARKPIFARFRSMLADLVNERGPWSHEGSRGRDHEAFWKLWEVESDDRVRSKLVRNIHGSHHAIASARTIGDDDDDTEKDDTVPTSPTHSSVLWKDLLKYQKRESVDMEKSEDGNGEDGDGVDDGLKEGDGFREEESTLLLREVVKEPVEVITASTNSDCGGSLGDLELLKSKLVFCRSAQPIAGDNSNNSEIDWIYQGQPSSVWKLDDIKACISRTHQYQATAVEIFFRDRTTFLVNFTSVAAAGNFQRKLLRRRRANDGKAYIPNSPYKTRILREASAIELQNQWVQRNIDNFTYIMHLNRLAGRSLKDLSQYPVFPWILKDYSSEKLDLNNPNSFRDLRYPVGAQRKEQRDALRMKYEELKSIFDDDPDMSDIPPHHNGTHYSNMAFVLWYLIRMEPYTSLHISLQSGKFDKPDRLFDSVHATWEGCCNNPSDVKELIPEWFTTPEIFININNLDLGTTQQGKQLGDVKLPPWANGSAHEFVLKHRQALESEHVSKNLHHWVDLIFGFRQRPPFLGGPTYVDKEGVRKSPCEEVCNVFWVDTYSGAFDLARLKTENPNLYSQKVKQIDNFGQTPDQLFVGPHPQRKALAKLDIYWMIASSIRGADTIPKNKKGKEMRRPHQVVCHRKEMVSDGKPIFFIADTTPYADKRKKRKIVTIDAERILGQHELIPDQPDVTPPFAFVVDAQALNESVSSQSSTTSLSSRVASFLPSFSKRERELRVGVPFAKKGLASLIAMSPPSTSTVISRSQYKDAEEEARRLMSRAYESAEEGGSVKLGFRSNSDAHLPLKGRAVSLNPSPSSYYADEAYKLPSQLFALLPETTVGPSKIFSCGHWDLSIKVTATDTGRTTQSLNYQREVVTCMDITWDAGEYWLVTGSRDCTVVVWSINPALAASLYPEPLHRLYGHDDAVTCVSAEAELDILVSGSQDGTIIVYSLRAGKYIQSITVRNSMVGRGIDLVRVHSDRERDADSSIASGGGDEDHDTSVTSVVVTEEQPGSTALTHENACVTWVGISSANYIVCFSSDDLYLSTFSINGDLLATCYTREDLKAFCISTDGRTILTGGAFGIVAIRWIHSLSIANDGERKLLDPYLDGALYKDGSDKDKEKDTFPVPIRSLCLSADEFFLFVGLDNGELRILTQDSMYLRKRLDSKLREIGI